LTRRANRGPSPPESFMKTFIQCFTHFLARLRTRSIEEQYLAQAVDASDYEVRLQVLERGRY
jgi:hypothetical protein